MKLIIEINLENAAFEDDGPAEVQRILALTAALAHALEFIERTHRHFDDPIEEIAEFSERCSEGEMTCNLDMLRDALKGAE